MSSDCRSVRWPGAYNIRDLGGLDLATGGETVYGRVFRSGRVEYLTAAGWSAAAEAGLATIVDLRNADERHRRPDDPALAPDQGATAKGIETLHCPIEDMANPSFAALQKRDGYDHPRSYPHHLSELPELMANLFRSLLQARQPVLVHCQQGRDRTGLVASFLLSLNGVTAEAIAADYALALAAANADLVDNPGHSSEAPMTDAELAEATADRATTLTAWLASFDQADYLASAGLATEEIEALSQLLRP